MPSGEQDIRPKSEEDWLKVRTPQSSCQRNLLMLSPRAKDAE